MLPKGAGEVPDSESEGVRLLQRPFELQEYCLYPVKAPRQEGYQLGSIVREDDRAVYGRLGVLAWFGDMVRLAKARPVLP